ncbi:hypothetical protein AQUCO_00700021v1 [Aquilegia coerulea]|uniref:Protein kinase domain-containing protein n=1 Tax=Aquilegia coerulea TaxID=218851 RepID=A0A2G5EI49_AQUCA|nr:hypothetical protein AQUCO_00700021v1 [Aquilegia coerulea]
MTQKYNTTQVILFLVASLDVNQDALMSAKLFLNTNRKYISRRIRSNGIWHKRISTPGISSGAIAGISIGGIAAVLLVAVCIYVGISRRKKREVPLLLAGSEGNSNHHGHGSGIPLNKTSELAARTGRPSPGLSGITVDKSVEFSYEELAQATDNFSLANKIGQGGFGAVYYAELRGEKAAIKKMDMQATKEFLAELKVLTHVHHLNLVRLIGYCVEGSLFLVYEFIENGNLK